jgi:hypothetical protein
MRTTNPDDRLAARALRLGWRMPDKERTATLRAMIRIVLSKSRGVSPRAKVGAFKALLAVDKATLEGIRTSITAREHDELVERLTALEKRRDEFDKTNPQP